MALSAFNRYRREQAEKARVEAEQAEAKEAVESDEFAKEGLSEEELKAEHEYVEANLNEEPKEVEKPAKAKKSKKS